VSSHDYNTENYKYDMVIGYRVECRVLGLLGQSACFRMRIRSDHMAYSFGQHLECLVQLDSTRQICGIRSLRVHDIVTFQEDACESDEYQVDGEGTYAPQRGPVNAGMVAHGPNGADWKQLGELGHRQTHINGPMLAFVAQELGTPSLTPEIFWSFLCAAMVPQFPNAQVDLHQAPRNI